MEVQTMPQQRWESPHANGAVSGNEYLSDDEEFEGGNDASMLYERSRIKALANEREGVQMKTFTKWVNSHLSKVSCHIEELYVDLRDGKMLLKLLEILSGEKLPNPTRGKMRIHCLENVDKSLSFLNEMHVHLENLGAHDIVDGNSRLTLGLIWTIILRFQIQDITVEPPTGEAMETKSAKDALLLWCQMKTAGYPHCNVRNFTTSWRDGLAFCALINKHRPDVLDYNQCSKATPLENLEKAFSTAEKLGIPRLLDAEDVNVESPDEKSIITYVVSYYHYFNKMKADNVHSKRIGKLLDQALDLENMQNEYEKMTSDLLEWIETTINILDDREFANTLSGVQQHLAAFNTYRTVEKPPKFKEKGDLEILYFTIQSRLRANNQKDYHPPEGKYISDVNRAWEALEKAEHAREIDLREELIRQEKLEQLANRFSRKATLRESWLNENQCLLAQDNFGDDLPAVEAATKKHEAIETDIKSYEERVTAVINVANELERENYHEMDLILQRKNVVLESWQTLLDQLKSRRMRLELSRKCQTNFQEMSYLLDWIDEIVTRLRSDDFGKHLMGVEDLIQKHGLLEADIRMLGKKIDQTIDQSQQFIDCNTFPEEVADYKPCSPDLVRSRGQDLKDAYRRLLEFASQRLKGLDQSKEMWQFFWDMADEEEWIKEKDQLMCSPDLGHDIGSVERLLRKHKALEDEIQNHQTLLKQTKKRGENLIMAGNMGAGQIKNRIDELDEKWDELVDITSERRKKLLESKEFYQFMSDCDDSDAYMVELLRQVSLEDLGNKLSVTESYLKKNKEVMDLLENFRETLRALEEQGDRISEYPEVDGPKVSHRLEQLAQKYKDLHDMADKRQKALEHTLKHYKVNAVADTVHTWITEKEKLLTTLTPSDEIDELAVLRTRFDHFNEDFKAQKEKVAAVKDISDELKAEDYPDTSAVAKEEQKLQASWGDITDAVDKKRHELQVALLFNEYVINCEATENWIQEKMKLIESTDELGNDLDGIMQLQRRLGGLQRDLTVLEAKLTDLDKKADELSTDRPADEERIREEQAKYHDLWDELKKMLNVRDEKLNSSSELQNFLQDLDHFQVWLSNAQTRAASEEIPKDLDDAERYKKENEDLIQEVKSYEPEFSRLMNFGKNVTIDQTDPQYMFLNQRLNGINESWDGLNRLLEDRSNFLKDCIEAQLFFRDALTVDVLLSKQELYLAKEEVPSSLEAAQDAIKDHDNFATSTQKMDDKIDKLLAVGDEHVGRDIFNADRIRAKCDQIRERRDSLRKKSDARRDVLQEALLLQEFLQEVEDVEEWISERNIVASDDSYRQMKNLAAVYSKFRAFTDELNANRGKVTKINDDGKNLGEAHPSIAEPIEARLDELNKQWDDLNKTAQDKNERLADANREKMFNETKENVEAWVNVVQESIITDEDIDTQESIVQISEKANKQQQIMRDHEEKKRQLQDLKDHGNKLREQYPDRAEEIENMETVVQQRLLTLEAPLQRRDEVINRKKQVRLLFRDIDDERDWVDEKLRVLNNADNGNSLLVVQQLLRRHRLLTNEVENHKPQMERIGNDIDNYRGRPEEEKFRYAFEDLKKLWDQLDEAVDQRQSDLDDSAKIQQYLFDSDEAKAWMGEQELYLMGDDKAKDEQGAKNAIKKHELLKNGIEFYGEEIRTLGDQANEIMQIPSVTPEQKEQVGNKQAAVDRQYAGLKELCRERSQRLDEILMLYQLKREIFDLEAWIADRTVIAASHDMGSDYEHCCLLRERFSEFTRDTKEIGKVRVGSANNLCDESISNGHTESAEIAEWKDRVNEAWADLLELMETRTQLLKAAWDLQKFLSDCQDVLDRIAEKALLAPEESGRDAKTVNVLQRKHAAFEAELARLGNQVESIVESAKRLLPSYAGEKERTIQDKRDQVVNAWRNLKNITDQRKIELLDSADFHRFWAMVRELRIWMDALKHEMNSTEKPRDVSGVELLMNSHRSLKAELDARMENFSICLSLGRTLLHRGHPRQEEVREKCIAVVTEHQQLKDQWNDRWEDLGLMLEVFQFARDAAVAEAWLISQEPYLNNRGLGENLDETLALLKKHLAFEKAVLIQEERFAALKKLTTFELRERERTPETMAARKKERQRRIDEAVKEFQPPPKPKVDPRQAILHTSTPQAEQATQQQTVQSQRPEDRGTPKTSTMPRTTDGSTPSTSQTDMEGPLGRKHEWAETGKKAGNRSWQQLYFMLRASDKTLSAYKDQRHAREKPGDRFHHETPISVVGCTAAPAQDYAKKQHVLRLRTPQGGEFLFQAPTEGDMYNWVQTINALARSSQRGSQTDMPTSSKYATLPAPASTTPAGARGGSDIESGAESATPGTRSSKTKKKFLFGGKK